MNKKILIVVLLFFAACTASSKSVKTAESSGHEKILKGQNSYYYFLASQLKDNPDTVLEAEKLLDMALKKDDRSSFLWAQKALMDAEQSHWDVALEDARKSLSHDENNVDSLVLVGKLHAAKRNPQQAIVYYKKALALNQTSEEIYNVMAREYLTLNDKKNAVQSLKTCLAAVPESSSCLYYLATIELDNKNFQEALKYFNLILELNPENTKILQTIGEIYLQQKDYDKAIEAFLQLKRMEPKNVTHSIRLALIYYETKKTDKAIEEFAELHERFPKSDRMNYFLGLLWMDQKDFDKAYDFFDHIKTESEFLKEAVGRMLTILKDRNDVSGAVDLLDRKLGKKEASSGYYNMKVSLLLQLGDSKKALQEAEDGLAKFVDEENLMLQKAIALHKLDRWTEAKAELLRLIQIHPENARAYNYIGYTLIERNENLDEALGYLLKSNALDPNDGHITDSLAWAYYKKGDYQKALGLLIKANRQFPNEPTIMEHLGDAYLQLKNKSDARSAYEKALQILSDDKTRIPEEEKQLIEIQKKLGGF